MIFNRTRQCPVYAVIFGCLASVIEEMVAQLHDTRQASGLVVNQVYEDYEMGEQDRHWSSMGCRLKKSIVLNTRDH